ncbi:hypothetical protein cypCar_00034915, partial [Cyprinus carpio]
LLDAPRRASGGGKRRNPFVNIENTYSSPKKRALSSHSGALDGRTAAAAALGGKLGEERANAATSSFREELFNTERQTQHEIELTVLFRAAGLSGAEGLSALLSPTTRGLREAMKAEGIEFCLPLLEDRRKSEDLSGGAVVSILRLLLDPEYIMYISNESDLSVSLLLCMETLQARAVNVKTRVRKGYQDVCSLEVTGPIMPHTLHALTQLLKPAQKGEFSVGLYTHEPTAVLNVPLSRTSEPQQLSKDISSFWYVHFSISNWSYISTRVTSSPKHKAASVQHDPHGQIFWIHVLSVQHVTRPSGALDFIVNSRRVCVGFFLQTSEVQVYVGESVVLRCNGSGFPVEELHVHWEAMGKDVISLRGDAVAVGRGFEDRVNFLRDPAESEDFSLILSDVMLNDGDIYECLWEGTKPICFVFLQVSTPAVFTDHVQVFEGVDITLDCFGDIPKNKPWEEIYIQWLKDDREILRLSSGQMDVSVDYSVLRLPAKHDISRGIFSLSIASVMMDTSVTETDTDSEVWSSTVSLSHTQTVWAQTESSSSVLTLTYAERDGVTDTSVPETVTDSVTTDTSVPETDIDSVTTALSIPDTDTDSSQLFSDEIPWIRIGLISGVLLLTAVFLALLLVFGRI